MLSDPSKKVAAEGINIPSFASQAGEKGGWKGQLSVHPPVRNRSGRASVSNVTTGSEEYSQDYH